MSKQPPTKTPAPSAWLERNRTNATWITGLGGVVFVTVFWALSGRFSPEILVFFGTLMGVGETLGAVREYVRTRDEDRAK